MTNEEIKKYNVFVLKGDGKIPALIMLDQKGKRLILEFKDERHDVKYDLSWFKTLRNLDKQINKSSYKLLCNGTSKNVGVTGFLTDSNDGLYCYYFDRKTGGERNIVSTLSYANWNEYATEEEQRVSFFGKKFAELIDKGWDAAQKELKKLKKRKNE